MSILQDNDFLERMLLSLGIPAIFSAGFFVWWLVDGAPEPQARVSAARPSVPRLFESDSFLSQPSSEREPGVGSTNAVAILTETAVAPEMADGADLDAVTEEEDPEAEARRARFSALEEQFNSELRSGRRAPQTAEFLNKELTERFARLSSIEIDSNVVCTGSVCQVTLASAESVATLLTSSSGAIHHLLPGSVAGALSESEAAETRARYQATTEVPSGQAVEGIRFLVPRESIQEGQNEVSGQPPLPSRNAGAVQEMSPPVDVAEMDPSESDRASGVERGSQDGAVDEESATSEDDGDTEEESEEE